MTLELAVPSISQAEGLYGAFQTAKACFAETPFPSAYQREQRLRELADAIGRRTDDLVEAIEQDFGTRQKNETLLMEIFVTVAAFRHAAKHVASWMAPRRRRVPWELGLGKAWVQPQPLGVVGVIAPWNYPLVLALGPVADALAAGNHVMVKPSELTPRASALMAEIISQSSVGTQVQVILGDLEVSRTFSALPFDHLLFTGSGRVGRMVMRAAADNLTPVTLELGGKSPAIVLPDADLPQASRDIVFGKFVNCGQTCVAPDFVMVGEDKKEALIVQLKEAAEAYFGGNDTPLELTSILGAESRLRQEKLFEEARARGVRIEALTRHKVPGLSFCPSAVIDPPEDLALCQTEIFGPILPVLGYRSPDEAFDHVRNGPRPLACYLFGRDRGLIDIALHTVTAGAMVINDTLVHVGINDLPFGGVGASGMGSYHGKDGFDRFSHLKAVFHRGSPRIDTLIRPPFTDWKERLARFLINT